VRAAALAGSCGGCALHASAARSVPNSVGADIFYRFGYLPGPVGRGSVMVLPTSPGDAPGETPIIPAASDIGSVIVLPTSAGDTPRGTPMAFIASEKGTVNRGVAKYLHIAGSIRSTQERIAQAGPSGNFAKAA